MGWGPGLGRGGGVRGDGGGEGMGMGGEGGVQCWGYVLMSNRTLHK